MKRLLFGTIGLLSMSAPVFSQEARILEIENTVETAAGVRSEWKKAAKDETLRVGGRIRTGENSRAAMEVSSLYKMRLDEFTTIEITPAVVSGDKSRLKLLEGVSFFFSREKFGEIELSTPTANGALKGTQLMVRVYPGGRSFYQVMEGSVELTNSRGRLLLGPGEAGEAAPGSAPKRTAVLDAVNILQWALYYPAVLDPDELNLSAAEEIQWATSLAAYRSGDMTGALETCTGLSPASSGGRLYRASLLLAAGRVDKARALLAGVPAGHHGRLALERMIAATQYRPGDDAENESREMPVSNSSGAMAESYYQQSRARLSVALEAARLATEMAPGNGYAWTRVAELEFSFSRHREAEAALARALTLTPKNARAHAIRGFILSAQYRIAQARDAFEYATRLDGALGNGWLGLGLTKIKSGDTAGGRSDLQTAATVEPVASVFHSYLGKALSTEGRRDEGLKDLALARQLDPRDPTPWLYAAIDSQQHNRTNTAIAELEESIRLNDNRRIYRSQFLLDQDRAVRSANLAKIYQNAGMYDVAVREAARAVESDYTSAPAHLFLANSFDALRDPKRIALRYETPWFNELLLANLFSPVGGGPLSQYVSQQEYSRLLEKDGMGGSVTSEYRDTGEWRSGASLFGTSGNVSYGIDASFRSDPGGRPNSESERTEIYGQLKWQASPDDIVYLLGKWQDLSSGDNFETYNNQPLSPGFDFQEKQEPGLALGGWNHRWAPGVNTLFLGGRLSAVQRLSDPSSRQLLIQRDSAGLHPGFLQYDSFGFEEFTDPALRNANPPAVRYGADGESLIYSPALIKGIAPYLGAGEILDVSTAPFDFYTQRKFDLYTGEIQHIWQTDRNTLLAGGRWQTGTFDTDTRLSVERPNFNGGFATPAVEQHLETDFNRTSLYAYDYWKPLPWLTLVGGLAWDRVDHPDNFRNPPVNDLQRVDEKVSGKLGFTAVPSDWVTVRGAYAQGLGGVTFDESVRLEPVQLSGFNQSYRTVLSESIAGSVEAPEFEIWGLSMEGRLPARTWWGVAANVIQQDVDRTIGAFTGYDSGVFPNSPAFFADSSGQQLDYHEESLSATINRLLGDEFAVGAGYRVTRSSLRTIFTGIPDTLVAGAEMEDEATLHEFSLYANWNSPRGFFARVEANWFSQHLDDDPDGPASNGQPREGDQFWQFNALTGYRFHRNLCEISAGVLNIGGGDYRLSPLNPYGELAREQTFVLRCRFSF